MALSVVIQLVACLSFVALIFGAENQEKKNGSRIQEREDIPDCIAWEAPDDIKNRFLYYLAGYDYDDLPILVMEMGRWDFQGVAEKGGEELENANLYLDQILDRGQAGYYSKNLNGSNSSSILYEVVVLLDFEGLKLSQIRSPQTLKLILERMTKMGRIYPNLAYGFVVNANHWAHQVISIVKPFIGNFLEKLEIYGTNSRKWIPKLLKKLPRNTLHPAYGGHKDYLPVTVFG